jgi:hypothetical protein
MNIEELRPLAKSLGGRVGRGDYYNANVGQRALGVVRALVSGYRVEVRPAETLVDITIRGFSGARVLFSANRPDRLFLLRDPIEPPLPGGIPLFGEKPGFQPMAQVRAATLAWLQDASHRSLVADLNLRPHESLHVSEGGVTLVGEPDRATPETIKRLCAVADALRVPDVPNLEGFGHDPPQAPRSDPPAAARDQCLPGLLRRRRDAAGGDPAGKSGRSRLRASGKQVLTGRGTGSCSRKSRRALESRGVSLTTKHDRGCPHSGGRLRGDSEATRRRMWSRSSLPPSN